MWTMRVWLLALMIALLPLRGWVGGAMALTAWPAEEAPGLSVVAATPCHGEKDMASGDAHALSTDLAPGAPSGHGGDHAGCNSCDICHGTVLFDLATFAGDLRPPSAQPALAHSRFASAVLPGQHKPPIA